LVELKLKLFLRCGKLTPNPTQDHWNLNKVGAVQ
jgi:hypothetical protein